MSESERAALFQFRHWVVVVPSQRIPNAAPSIFGPMTKAKAVSVHEMFEDAYYQKLEPTPEAIP